MKHKARQIRRSFGVVLDAVTIFDHAFSRKTNLFHQNILNAEILLRIEHSPTIVIYGSYFNTKRASEEACEELEKVEEFWPVVRIANSDALKVKQGWLLRKNKGRDLSLFREFVEIFGSMIEMKNILWINSSCVWDSRLLVQCLKDLESDDFAGVTSLTDSWIGGYHLQSYFLFIDKRVASETISVVIDTMKRNWKFKRTLVHRGERKLSHNLRCGGIDIRALYPAELISPHNFLWENSYTHNADLLYSLPIPGRKNRIQKKKLKLSLFRKVSDS